MSPESVRQGQREIVRTACVRRVLRRWPTTTLAYLQERQKGREREQRKRQNMEASESEPFPLYNMTTLSLIRVSSLTHREKKQQGEGMYGPSDADFATDKRPQNGAVNAQPALMVPSWDRSAHRRIAFHCNGRNFAEAGTV